MNPSHSHTSVQSGPRVHVNLADLCANFDFLSEMAPSAETAAVVKCNAYGLGLEPIAYALAERSRCRTFFVAYPEEGAELRRVLRDIAPTAAIYVFSGPTVATLSCFDESRLTPVINSAEQAALWSHHRPDQAVAIHLDTGINRLGVPGDTIDAIASYEGLNVSVFMSHLACGAEPQHEMNKRQRDAFAKAAERFPSARRSLAASAGILIDPSFHFDLTRPGISLYGGSPFNHPESRIKPVATLSAPIIQLRTVSPGQSVGYGATFTAKETTNLAVVALGYGDGFPISGSNRAVAVINGEPAPVAGRISMDLICLDISRHSRPPKIGDRAEFFGPSMALFDAARACETASYELLTGLGERVDRRYV